MGLAVVRLPEGRLGLSVLPRRCGAVILLFTDAPFHNGPGVTPSNPYRGIVPAPHTYDEARTELQAHGARVIGFDSGEGWGATPISRPRRGHERARHPGSPLVFDIGRRGERLGTGVVNAIKLFAEAIVFDIDAVASDPDPATGSTSRRSSSRSCRCARCPPTASSRSTRGGCVSRRVLRHDGRCSSCASEATWSCPARRRGASASRSCSGATRGRGSGRGSSTS